MDTSCSVKVLFEQYSIPHYRVPFFNALAKEVDLLVLASDKPTKGGGVNDVRTTPGFRSMRLASHPESGLYHSEIIELLRRERPDVLVSWNTSLRLLLRHPEGCAVLKEIGTKIIWMGCDGYETHHFLLAAISAFLPWRIQRTVRDFFLMRKINHFITYSSHTKNYLRRVKWIRGEKITVVHNAIDTSTIAEVYHSSREHITKRAYGLVFVGRLIHGKHIEVLLQALQKVLHSYPEASLTLIGDGPFQPQLEAEARKLDIANRIRFIGGIYDDRALAEQLMEHSLFVLPGIGGLSFNTAMAAGLPIIHTYADGTEKDLITEGVNGWFFDGSASDLARKIDHAFSNLPRLTQMGEVSERLLTQKFTLRQMVDGYAKILKQIA